MAKRTEKSGRSNRQIRRESVRGMERRVTHDTERGDVRARERALAAARVAAENQGQDILVIDVRALTDMFDYLVVATGRSGRQLRAIADETEDVMLRDFHEKRRSVSGYTDSRWIVLDFGDVMVNLFDPQSRNYYRLEDLWGDGQRVALS
ncbi:MAG: ribosome silencing factor [Planctomycetota bacterium]